MATKIVIIITTSKFSVRKITNHFFIMIGRLSEFIKNQRISVRAFEQKISASDGMVRRAINNNTDIQSRWLANIADSYPQLSMEWLITGKGEMLRQPDTELDAGKGVRLHKPEVDDGYKGKYLELIEKYAALQEKHIALKDEYNARYEVVVRENNRLKVEVETLTGKPVALGKNTPELHATEPTF